LRKKSVDIGAFCCPPSQSDRLPGLEFHSLGISPIALIVHPANPLKNMTVKQARKVFQGQINHWSELEPKSSKIPQQIIKPVARLHCKIRPGHWRGLLNNEDEFSPRLFEVGVIADMISQVANNTGAIGFEVPLMVSYHGNKGLVRMLDIDGHNVTDLSYLLAGKYPFYRSYSLTTWKSDSKEKYRIAKELVNYLQQYIEKNHTEISYIPPSQLRLAGWKFSGDELVGGPVSTNINKH
jgi:ABC-type phosphate transport system substrate-binding protein